MSRKLEYLVRLHKFLKEAIFSSRPRTKKMDSRYYLVDASSLLKLLSILHERARSVAVSHNI